MRALRGFAWAHGGHSNPALLHENEAAVFFGHPKAPLWLPSSGSGVYDTPEGILFLADIRVVTHDRELGWLYLAVAAILLDLQDRRNRLLCAVTLSHRLGLDPVRYVSN